MSGRKSSAAIVQALVFCCVAANVQQMKYEPALSLFHSFMIRFVFWFQQYKKTDVDKKRDELDDVKQKYGLKTPDHK